MTTKRTGEPEPHADPSPHLAVVRRYLLALGAAPHEADDLAQETMLHAVRGAHASAGGDQRAFLIGVARNLWLRSRRWWQRRREREIAAAVDELWQQAAEHDGGDELVERLRHCLDRLQPRARLALDLHYRDGLAWPDVAARVDMKPNGIKTLAQRTRNTLRDCIERRNDR